MSQLWNPKFRRKNDDTLTIPGNVPFVGTPITQQHRDDANDRLNAMIHDHHVKLGNAVADDESGDNSED